MTIEATGNRVSLTGNGVTTTLAFPYPVSDPDTDLVVIETIILTGVQTTKVVTTDWTWSGTPDAAGHYPDGGTITALAAPAATVTWIAYRDPPAIQSLDLVENDDAPAEAQEAAYDYLTMLIQRIKEQATRSLRQPEGDSVDIGRIPSKVDRLGKFLYFNLTTGEPEAIAAFTSDPGSSVVTAFMATVLDDTTAALARATLEVPNIAGDTFTGNVTVTKSSLPMLAVNTTHASNFAAQVQFRKNGTTKFLLAVDINQGGTNDFTIYDAAAALARVVITSAGVLSLPIGQILFPATQNPSADANTLDDYEEFTWTPTIGGTATYTTQNASYTKVGRLVTAKCELTINSLGSGSTSVISGLPFPSTRSFTAAVMWANGAVTPVTVVGITSIGVSTVTLYGITAANASLSAIALMGNGTTVNFTMVYETT